MLDKYNEFMPVAITMLYSNNIVPFDSVPIPKLNFLDSRTRKPIIKKYQNIGRNELCPCGSGKKFKRCCIDIIITNNLEV